MQVLLLEDNEELRDRLRFVLESTYGSTVTDAARMKDAVACVTSPGSSFDLIVHDLQQASPEEFQEFLEANLITPILICTHGSEQGKTVEHPNVIGKIDRSALVQNLMKAIEERIEKGLLRKPDTEARFCRIRTKLLLSVCPLKTDIYIRLSEWKFVKLFQQGDVFDLADMEKYTLKKGVEYLYLRKEETREFIDKYAAELSRMLATMNLSLENVQRSAETAHETVRELGQRVGFTPAVQAIARTQVQMTMKSIGRSPKLADMIARMRDQRGSYIASHSTMVAYFSCAIASQMQWGSETTFHKLNLAAFLHDITLTDQKIATYETLAELERDRGQFPEALIQEYKLHPVKGAEVARQFSEVPPDVDVIIVQHHERPDGSGFPRGLTHTYISPLAALFIIAHDLTSDTLSEGPYFSLPRFVAKMRARYKTTHFKKVVAALETL